MNTAEKTEPVQYAATYRFPGRKGVVHVVAPPPMTEAEKERIVCAYYEACWAAWNSLSVEERLKINAECEAE